MTHPRAAVDRPFSLGCHDREAPAAVEAGLRTRAASLWLLDCECDQAADDETDSGPSEGCELLADDDNPQERRDDRFDQREYDGGARARARPRPKRT